MKELRTIIFEGIEAAGAVIEFCRKTSRKLPAGTVKTFEVIDSGGSTGVLRIVDDYGAAHDVTFAQEEVAAALVNYCMTRNIPLPRSASKVITAVDSQVVLAFEIGHANEVKRLVRASRMRDG